MVATSKIKTGILSFGMSGKLFQAPFLEEHQGFELFGVVERSKKIAAEHYPKIKSYNSIDQMIEDVDIELIVINTPNATHYEFALKAIRAKKHVLIEKPFTIKSVEAKHLFKEAKKHKCQIMAYQNRRYDSDFLSLKDVIDAGRLGNLIEVHIRYDRYRYALSPSAFKESRVPGSGVTYNLGPHIIDQALALFGTPQKWTKDLAEFRPNTLVDDYCHVHLSYETGLQVYLTASLLVAEPGPAFIAHGTLGSYKKSRTDMQEEQLQKGIKPSDPEFGHEKPNCEGQLTTISVEGEKNRENVPSVKSTYMNLFEDVYLSIRHDKPYPVREQDILQQLEILEL